MGNLLVGHLFLLFLFACATAHSEDKLRFGRWEIDVGIQSTKFGTLSIASEKGSVAISAYTPPIWTASWVSNVTSGIVVTSAGGCDDGSAKCGVFVAPSRRWVTLTWGSIAIASSSSSSSSSFPGEEHKEATPSPTVTVSLNVSLAVDGSDNLALVPSFSVDGIYEGDALLSSTEPEALVGLAEWRITLGGPHLPPLVSTGGRERKKSARAHAEEEEESEVTVFRPQGFGSTIRGLEALNASGTMGFSAAYPSDTMQYLAAYRGHACFAAHDRTAPPNPSPAMCELGGLGGLGSLGLGGKEASRSSRFGKDESGEEQKEEAAATMKGGGGEAANGYAVSLSIGAAERQRAPGVAGTLSTPWCSRSS